MAKKVKIISNHHERQFNYRDEVPKNVLSEDFEWLGEGAIDGFFKYLNCWFHLSEFSLIPEGDKTFSGNWEGFFSSNVFAGTLIKLSDDGETYQIASYFG